MTARHFICDMGAKERIEAMTGELRPLHYFVVGWIGGVVASLAFAAVLYLA